MAEKKKNNREWVKNVAIVFLIILLILTFFSNTILNYSLPEVAAQYVDSGTITSKIRGSGVIESDDPYNVKIKQTKTVDSIEVKSGDYVEKGQVICYLSSDDSAELDKAKVELEAAQSALKTAENNYLLQILTSGYDTSVIQNGAKIQSTEAYLAQITAAKTAIDNAQKDVDNQNNVIADLQKKSKDLATQIELTPPTNVDYSAEQAAYNAAKTEADNAALILTQCTNNLDAINREITRIIGITPEGTDPDLGYLPQQKIDAEIAVNTATTNKNNADYQLSAAEIALNNKKASGDTSGTIQNLRNQQIQITAQIEKEQVVLEQKNAILQNKTDELTKLTGNISATFGLVSLQDAIDTAKNEVKRKQDAVNKLETDNNSTAVEAPISGTIIDLMIKSGDETPVDGIVATMQPEGKGYRMSMTVTNEQAKRLSVGDRADLINSWRYDDMDIVIASIKPDKSNPGKNKVINFDISGDSITAGQSINVSVGQKSSNYDMIVPNSAIHEDNDGKFIYIVESKSSPIGTRYYASKVDVEVLASDDTRSAISGGLYGYEFVITTSTKPIEKNKQIRLAD